MSKLSDATLNAIFTRRQTSDATGPLEDAWERTTWHRIVAGYNFDLAVAAVIYLAAVVIAISVIIFAGLPAATSALPGVTASQGLPTSLQIIFGTAVFGTFIELLRRTYDAAIKRLATIDLFTSEILSIMRVFASANIIGDFIRLYDRFGTPNQSAEASAPATEGGGDGIGFADSARAEDYFTVFNANSQELASLDPAIINDIAAFYTFLKASRDATGAIKLWKSPTYRVEDKKDDIIAIVFLCFLLCVHGQLALDKLIASEDNRAIANDIFAGVMLQCFSFLYYVIPQTDFRWARIEQRRTKCESLRLAHRYEIPIERHEK